MLILKQDKESGTFSFEQMCGQLANCVWMYAS